VAAVTADHPFWYLGGKVRVTVPGAATSGKLSVLTFDDPQDAAPPLHVHEREDELWVVLDGRITVFLGDEEHDLEAGQAAFGPRGVPHSYLVRSPRARLAAVYLPSGLDEHFAANGTPVVPGDDTPAPFDLDAVVASAAGYGLLVAGPPPTP
jgi:mannose-6-phosphate isomerase-like protein (cupin superfamily)